MVMAVTISWELRKIVSARSTVTDVSTGPPVWSTPLTRSVSRGSDGSGRTRYSSSGSLRRISALGLLCALSVGLGGPIAGAIAGAAGYGAAFWVAAACALLTAGVAAGTRTARPLPV